MAMPAVIATAQSRPAAARRWRPEGWREGGEATGEESEEGTREDTAAEDGDEGGGVTGDRDAEAALEGQGTTGREGQTADHQKCSEPGPGPDGVADNLWGVAYKDLRGWRACGGPCWQPAGDHGRDHRERDGGTEFGKRERCRLDGVGVVEGVDRAADEPDGSLRSGPAEQAPDESARDAKQGGLSEPRAADLRGGDPERSQDPDLLASSDDGTVERLEDEVESDQKGEQRKDGEVETERAGHDGARVTSV